MSLSPMEIMGVDRPDRTSVQPSVCLINCIPKFVSNNSVIAKGVKIYQNGSLAKEGESKYPIFTPRN